MGEGVAVATVQRLDWKLIIAVVVGIMILVSCVVLVIIVVVI